MKKPTKKKRIRKEWTAADVKALRSHSKQRTPVAKVSKEMKRTIGALRAKAFHLNIPLGHRR